MGKHSSESSLRRVLAALLVAALLCAAGRPARAFGAKGNSERTLTVMTRNMYLGADLSGAFAAQSQTELVGAVTAAYAGLRASEVPRRVAAMADEIAAARPDLVSLQEVALWRTGAFLDPAPAETTAYDFLQLLLDELAARGQHYATVKVLDNFDAEAPAFFGPTEAFDVRFTDRDAVIARTDLKTSQMKIESVRAEHFATSLSIPTAVLGVITIPRGWIAADVKLRGKTYRFVGTHLESFEEQLGLPFPYFRYAQAIELLQGPANTELPLVMAGDFNADAENPADPTYQLLLGAGLTDAWEATRPDDPGYTWALFLSNPFAYTVPTQRLDLVLSRGGITPVASDLVGEEDVTPTSPMPSDHAGVVASFRLEP